MKRWIAGALMAALTACLLVGVDAQSGATANVEVRVWQRVADAESLYISARPERGSWRTLGTIPIAMSGLSQSGRYHYGDITVTVPVRARPTPSSRCASGSGRATRAASSSARARVAARGPRWAPSRSTCPA